MTALALVALLLPVAAVLVLLPEFPRGSGNGVDALVARIATATGIAVGMSSSAFFLSLLLFDGALWSVLAFDLVPLALAAIAWRRGRVGARAPSAGAPRWEPTGLSSSLSSLFGAVLLASLVGFVLAAIHEPHGQWDAWAIWNAKARFLARAGAGWRIVLSEEAASPDYPLLLPGAIARAWSYSGAESALVSIVVAGLFAMAAIASTAAALSILRGRAQGMIAAILLAPALLAEAAHQYADVPLSFYVLATVVLLALHDRSDPAGRGLPLLAGLAAGMAAWTKNEGLIFLFLAVGARTFLTFLDGGRAKRQSLLWFALGAVPFLVLNSILRLWLLGSAAPMSFLRWDAVSAQLFDPVRYWRVAAAVAGQAMRTTPILPAVIGCGALLGLSADRGTRQIGRTGFCLLALMLAAFFAVYVVTPHDLAWHVSTTLGRLLIQIAPLAVFTVLLVTSSPDEQRQAEIATASARPRTNLPDRSKPRRRRRSSRSG